jgi:hypothetical protein
MESKLLVESLGFSLGGFIKINNSPFLVSSILVSIDDDSLSFLVFGSIDREGFVICPVDELCFFKFEQLEPSAVGAPDLH